MRSCSPVSRARACAARSAYCSGLLPESVVAVNMRSSLAAPSGTLPATTMAAMELPGIYVTGTDTGVGKSVVSAALVHALRADGRRVAGMKPVASGCNWQEGTWRNADALLLQAA